MKVKAATGLRVPTEKRANAYIEDQPVEVENSLYYRRLINDGDLIIVTEAQPLPTGKKGVDKNG